MQITVILYFEFLKKTSLAHWASQEENLLAQKQNQVDPGYQTWLSLNAIKEKENFHIFGKIIDFHQIHDIDQIKW